jgi:hypothetical protein
LTLVLFVAGVPPSGLKVASTRTFAFPVRRSCCFVLPCGGDVQLHRSGRIGGLSARLHLRGRVGSRGAVAGAGELDHPREGKLDLNPRLALALQPLDVAEGEHVRRLDRVSRAGLQA